MKKAKKKAPASKREFSKSVPTVIPDLPNMRLNEFEVAKEKVDKQKKKYADADDRVPLYSGGRESNKTSPLNLVDLSNSGFSNQTLQPDFVTDDSLNNPLFSASNNSELTTNQARKPSRIKSFNPGTGNEITGIQPQSVLSSKNLIIPKKEVRLPEMTTLSRFRLFETFDSDGFFPVAELGGILKGITGDTAFMDFTGIEQVTDFVFVTMYWHKQNTPSVRCHIVTKIHLTGCYHLTNQGIVWLSKAFPNLQEMYLFRQISYQKKLTLVITYSHDISSPYLTELVLIGCKNIDERIFPELMLNCTHLKKLDVSGTNVSTLPAILLANCVVKGPNCPIIEKHFSKTGGKDEVLLKTMKVCFVKMKGLNMNLLDKLMGNGGQKLTTYLEKKLTVGKKEQTFNIFECTEHSLDLFISERTTYFIAYQLKDKNKADRLIEDIFGMICHIRSQVMNAAFLLIDVREKNVAPVLSIAEMHRRIQDEIHKWRENTNKELKKLFDTDLKWCNFQKQQTYSRQFSLSENLSQCLVVATEISPDEKKLSNEGFQLLEKSLQMQIEKINSEIKSVQEKAESILTEVLPILERGQAELNRIDKRDISEFKSFANPPRTVKMVMEAVLIAFEKKSNTWGDIKAFLSDASMLSKLMNFDRDNMKSSTLSKLERYTSDPDFEPEMIGKISNAASGLCIWVLGIYKYGMANKEVQPQRALLQKLQEARENKQTELLCLKQSSDKQGITGTWIDHLLDTIAAPLIEATTSFYPEYANLDKTFLDLMEKTKVMSMFKESKILTFGEAARKINTLASDQEVANRVFYIMNLTGSLVCLNRAGKEPLIISPELLTDILNIVCWMPTPSLNEGKISVIHNKTPVWTLEELEKELKMLPDVKNSNEVTRIINLLNEIGVGHLGPLFIPFNTLLDDPPVPVETFFGKPGEVNPTKLKASYLYELPYSIPMSVFHEIMGFSGSVHLPTLAYQHGFVIQEGVVEVLIAIDKNTKDSSKLEVTVQCPRIEKELKQLKDMLFHTLEQYKVVVDYVLRKAKIHPNVTFLAEEQKPDSISTVIGRHKPSKNGEKKDVCQNCGMKLHACKLLVEFYSILYPAFVNAETDKLIEDGKDEQQKKSIEKNGHIYHTGSHPVQFKIGGYIDALDIDHISFTLTSFEVTSGLKVTFGLSHEKEFIEYNLKNFELKTRTKSADVPTSHTIPLTFHCGDTIKFSVNSVPEVRVMKNLSVINTIPTNSRSFSVYIQHGESLSTPTHYFIHPLTTQIHAGADKTLVPKMKLEALDRLNPHLVCVATIEEINEDGKLLIHFDGWTSKYDYWTEPESLDLHPLGYMMYVGHSKGLYNKTLQKPKNYGKPFDWATYMKECDVLPVPFDFFSEEQIDGCPMTEHERVMSQLEWKDTAISTACFNNRNRGACLENEVRAKLAEVNNINDFLEDNRKFMTILPSKLDLDMIHYMPFQKLTDLDNLSLHFLCPGLKIEVLHLSNCKGFKYESLGTNFTQMATYLEFCTFALLLQQNFMPTVADKFSESLKDATEKKIAEVEKNIRYLLRQICLVLQLHSRKMPKLAYKKASTVIADILSKMNSKEDFNAAFSGVDQSSQLVCTGHKLCNSAGKALQEVPMLGFSGVFSFIQHLRLQNNVLKQLPEDMDKLFPHLEELNISKNELKEIPECFANLKFLNDLDISGNKITNVPKEYVSLKKTLLFLNISDNPLSLLPPWIFEMTMLVELRANNIGRVKDLSKLKNLSKLTVLGLGYNILPPIPKEITSLPLKELNFSGVPLLQLSVSSQYKMSYGVYTTQLEENNALSMMTMDKREELFFEVDKEKTRSLSHSGVIDLNYKLYDKYMRIGNEKETKGKSGGSLEDLLLLTELEKLILQYQGIISVPERVNALKSLKVLDISNNIFLESLSGELGGLPLKELHLKDCPSLRTPPKEVVKRGFSSVYGYLKRLRQGAVPCKRTKLMFVGLGGAGKTSLVSALTEDYFDPYEDYTESITDGINISDWGVPLDGEKDPLVYSVWDFAGQTVYYNTHQFFLSNRAVYLLLWNIRLGYEHAGLDFWLSSIACHAPKAPVLIVGTHCDKVEKSAIPKEELMSRFSQIKGFYFVSSFTKEGIPDLKKDLVNITLKEEYMGEKIPEAWLNLEKEIIKKRDDEKMDLLLLKKLAVLADECGILDELELIQTLQFLHDLGSVQFYNTPSLKSHVIINCQWIVDVMARVVTVHKGAIQDGVFYHKDMKDVWQKYPDELRPWLLRLTEAFDLTFPMLNEDANIVPCLLPNEAPKDKVAWPKLEEDSIDKETKMVYTFQYLPTGLFNRSQVRLQQFCDSSFIWKKGSFLKKNNHIALLLQNSACQFTVKVQGFRPENILFLVHEVIESLITDFYSGVHYDYSIPCMDCCSVTTDPCMFPVSKINKALELKAPFLQCDDFHTISIPELKASMPPDQHTDFDDHLGRCVRELVTLEKNLTIKVFFCFSKKNVPSEDEAHKLVNPHNIVDELRSKGFAVEFTETPDTDPIEKLVLAIKQVELVIFGMSDEFAESEKCRDLAVTTRDSLRKPILLLLLGRTKEWQKSNFNLHFSDEVFVSMQQIERYTFKMKELVEKIRTKAMKKSEKSEEKSAPPCFISYCWSNSKDAIDLGSKKIDGALGWGDPRKLKEFLEKEGIKCWIDTERVGKGGLFEDIADGLRKARVFVACVSDEYVKSKNCLMEFRFALYTMKLPVIVAVVGTGNKWEKNEISLLATGHDCPKVNLQYDNKDGLKDLLNLVKQHMKKEVVVAEKVDDEKIRKVAFQEVLELAERKFLRYISYLPEIKENEAYPRLVILDFSTDIDRKNWQEMDKKKKELEMAAKKEEKEKVEGGDKNESSDDTDEKKEDEDMEIPEERTNKYCFRFLCEREQGWHPVFPGIPFPEMTATEETEFLYSIAPYFGRIYAILKHALLPLPIFETSEGAALRKKFDELCGSTEGDDDAIGQKGDTQFALEYYTFWARAAEEDENTFGGLRGNLARSHLPNGKYLWLCDEHQGSSRTVEKFKTQLKKQTEEEADEKNKDSKKLASIQENEGDETTPEKQSTVPRTRPPPLQRRLERQNSRACSVM